jgi:hypothetical protein
METFVVRIQVRLEHVTSGRDGTFGALDELGRLIEKSSATTHNEVAAGPAGERRV